MSVQRISQQLENKKDINKFVAYTAMCDSSSEFKTIEVKSKSANDLKAIINSKVLKIDSFFEIE